MVHGWRTISRQYLIGWHQMEGNDCYKFSTIKTYLDATGRKPIRLAIDVGCNIGQVTAMLRSFFPEALVIALEPVQKYYLEACSNLKNDPLVKVFPFALTAQHRYLDDLGQVPLKESLPLRTFFGLPHAGPGWEGGSCILREGESPGNDSYAPLNANVTAVTLDNLLSGACDLFGMEEIDYVKIDCEGCENSALGSARVETLRRIRYLSGEYHNLVRFEKVMRLKLFRTHYVNLVGSGWGSFFAERRGESPSILSPHSEYTLTWAGTSGEYAVNHHGFCEDYVAPDERWAHGFAGSVPITH
jgi:FkbM family methyltransferase